MQTTKEVNPHPRITPCVNMWSVTFFFFFFFLHLLNVGACVCHISQEGQVEWTTPHHTTPLKMLHFMLFHSVTCYANCGVSRIHVNTTKLCNVTCTLVATGAILRSFECTTCVATSTQARFANASLITPHFITSLQGSQKPLVNAMWPCCCCWWQPVSMISQSVSQSVCLSVCVCVSVSVSAFLCASPPVCLCVCVSVR